MDTLMNSHGGERTTMTTEIGMKISAEDAGGECGIQLKINAQGQLMFQENNGWTKVFLKRCFPWSEPLTYFSLRDESDVEKVLVEGLHVLNESSRNALTDALVESQFCFVVEDLVDVDEEFELRVWHVKTRSGERRFQTPLNDWPRTMPGGGLLIQDVFGDLYYIKDARRLPEPGKSKLWAFID